MRAVSVTTTTRYCLSVNVISAALRHSPAEVSCAMADTITPERRSANMALIRGKDTRPELFVRRALHALGYRFRLHGARLPGKPDLVLAGRRTVIFVHGCFWHRHTCGKAYVPKTRTVFWQTKFRRNKERDAAAQAELRRAGWRVIVVWECDLEIGSDAVERLVALLGPPGRSRQLKTKVRKPPSKRKSETPVQAKRGGSRRLPGR